MDIVVPQHVGSSRSRDGTSVPCLSRQIFHHWTTMEVPLLIFLCASYSVYFDLATSLQFLPSIPIRFRFTELTTDSQTSFKGLFIFKIFFFYVYHFLTLYRICYNTTSVVYVLVSWLWHMWDLSSPTRNWIYTLIYVVSRKMILMNLLAG